jgi:hypothetical protein
MNDKAISKSSYYLSQILRDLKQAKRALDAFKKACPEDSDARAIGEKLEDCYNTASRMYCEETIK